MFPFGSLPLLVKRQIISYAADAAARPTGWHVLLTVSHSFQQLSIPYIFRTVIFRHSLSGAYHALKNTSCATECHKIPLLPLPSISLTRYAKATRYARTLLVDLGTPIRFYDSTERLHQALALDSNAWTAVRSIYFFDLKVPNPPEGTVASSNTLVVIPKRAAAVARLADMLFKYMPNVVNLTFSFHYSFGQNYMLVSRLINKYYRQLQVFRSNIPLRFGPTQIDYNLTHLCVSFNDTVPYILSRIYSDIMRCLQIIELTPRFSWSCFARNKDGDLCFTNLACLALTFKQVKPAGSSDPRDNNNNPDKQSFRVLFPKLQTLVVRDQKTQLPDLFKPVHLSDTLQAIRFYNSLYSLHQLRNEIKINGLRSVAISVNYSVSQDMFYKTTNQYFGRPSKYSVSWLDIRMLGFSLKPSLIDWKTLDTLYIHEIHFITLTTLISQMPLLRYLDITIVSLLPEASVDRSFDPLDYARKTPFSWLSIKLKHLIILYITSTVPLSTRVLCFRDLVRRLPVLKEFRASQSSLGNQVHIP